MYVDVPTNVSAMELISSPETPKSQILISPRELHRIFDGLISAKERYHENNVSDDESGTRVKMGGIMPRIKEQRRRTAVNDTMHIIKICQPF